VRTETWGALVPMNYGSDVPSLSTSNPRLDRLLLTVNYSRKLMLLNVRKNDQRGGKPLPWLIEIPNRKLKSLCTEYSR
jgi:hypothetical protein